MGVLYEKLGKLKAMKEELHSEISRITTEIKKTSTMQLIGSEVEVEKAIQLCEEYVQMFESASEWIENKSRNKKEGLLKSSMRALKGL